MADARRLPVMLSAKQFAIASSTTSSSFVLLLIGRRDFFRRALRRPGSKIIVDLGLSAMLLFGAFIAIFVGVGLVYKEIERRTIYAIFSKPVGRGEFLVGKYLGLCLTLLVNVVVMGMGVSLALVYVSRGWDPLIARSGRPCC